MEQFLLANVDWYDTLVKRLKPSSASDLSNLRTGRQIQAKDDNKEAHPNMIVGARIRPWLEEDRAAGFPNAMFPRAQQEGSVDLHDLYNHPRGRPVLKSYSYAVDRLFDGETTTDTIYDDLVKDLVPFACNGGIATLFAYGQTGSGKTYTISRLEQLAVEALMHSNAADSNSSNPQWVISITIIELAGNAVFDLLSDRKPIAVRDDAQGVTQLVGAAEHTVSDNAQVLDLIEQAASFRRSAPTFKNAASSRSHAICRIRIKQKANGNNDINNNNNNNHDGFLYMIDLAGSEAARDIAVHGADRMREAKEINMSLSVLKDCMRGRAEADALRASGSRKAPPRIPFRQSALTRILKHVFDPTAGGQECKTAVIACVNPSLADVGASKNTLRYAELLRVQVPVVSGSRSVSGSGSRTGSGSVTPVLRQEMGSDKGAAAGAKGTKVQRKFANHPKAPDTWDNARLKEWIGIQLDSSMAASALAPTDSGAQFLGLSTGELERRRETVPSNATKEQIAILRTQLIEMHTASAAKRSKPSEGNNTSAAQDRIN